MGSNITSIRLLDEYVYLAIVMDVFDVSSVTVRVTMRVAGVKGDQNGHEKTIYLRIIRVSISNKDKTGTDVCYPQHTGGTHKFTNPLLPQKAPGHHHHQISGQ